jgi:N-acetylmuramoyl-L-alanine amidase
VLSLFRTLYIIFNLCFSSVISYSSLVQFDELTFQFNFSLPNGRLTKVSTFLYKSTHFCTLADISHSVFPGSIYNPIKSIIKLRNGELTCKSGNTFVELKSHGQSYIAAMQFPAIYKQEILAVPLQSFLKAISSLGIISTNKIDENTYSLSSVENPVLAGTFAAENVNEYQDLSDQNESLSIIDQNQHETLNNQLHTEPNTEHPNNTVHSIPGHYVIPENLHLSEDELMYKSQQNHQDKKEELKSIEQLSIEAEISGKGPIAITNATVSAKDSQINVLFNSVMSISSYQKPEFSGREIIVRFPNAINGIRDLSSLIDGDPIVSFKTEQIKTYLLYKIRLKHEIQSVSIKKIRSNQISLSIEYTPTTPIPKPSITEKKKWELDVIVVDPGHGGEDAGALSINGYKEKDIALAIAKKVRDQLKESMPSTRVIMTRTDDTFIELYRRGHIANQYKGKLFISIHCNSMPTKPHPANGCESYILRPGRNSEAVRVAEKENGSIKLEKEQSSYEDLNEEKLIVATMAQAAFVRFSERFSALLQKNVAKNTKMYNRGVNQAGFIVLVGASMPNVLFETGFLSNSADEKILISDAGQNNIAEGIVKAIITYSEDIIGNSH